MNNIRALYIEDEAGLGKVTSEVLMNNGYSVVWMQDGAKALDVFRNGKFDICIVDIMLPGMDGYTLVDSIRQTDANVPVIFLSARSLTEDVIKGFRTGGNDYLKKPFSIEELIVRMDSLIKRSGTGNATPEEDTKFNLGNYIFDRVAMTLVNGEDTIRLTHLESELLYHLVIRKNETLNRTQVLLDLWGSDSFFNARSMDVFISKLRKYLSGDDRISIVNIRGKGYKLIYMG